MKVDELEKRRGRNSQTEGGSEEREWVCVCVLAGDRQTDREIMRRGGGGERERERQRERERERETARERGTEKMKWI